MRTNDNGHDGLNSNDGNDGNGDQGQDANPGQDADGSGGSRQRGRRTTGVRASALRRAREAKQARDARRRQHEMTVEAALADYYAAVSYVEDVRARASRRAARILGEAEDSVQGPLTEADAALRRLRDLGETRETIRELTQASLGRLRAALNGETTGEAQANAGVEALARIRDDVGGHRSDRIEDQPSAAPTRAKPASSDRALTPGADPGPGDQPPGS